MMSAKPTVDGQFYTYAYLIWGAKSLLQTSEEISHGAGHVRRAAVVFAAFAIEAHATHIGVSMLGWSKSQARRSWKEKLTDVCAAAGVTPDYSIRPFKSIDTLYDFRTAHAHGKTSPVEAEAGDDGLPDLLDPSWLRIITTAEEARIIVEDAYAVMELLHTKLDVMPSLLTISSGAVFEELDSAG